MKHPRLIIAIIAVGLIVAVSFATLLGNLGHKKFQFSSAIGSNMRFATMTDSTHIRYFTGQSFREMKLPDQSTTALTPQFFLPTVTAIRWGKTGAAFRATGYSASDQLRSTIVRASLPTTAPYWWYVNFESGAISLIGDFSNFKLNGAQVDDVLWNRTQTSYIFTQTPTFSDAEQTTTLYRSEPGGAATKLAATDATHLLWANDTKLLYQSDTGSVHKLAELTYSSGNTRTIIDNFTGQATINSTGDHALIIAVKATEEVDPDSAGELKVIDLSTAKSTSVGSAFGGTIGWGSGNAWIALSGNSQAATSGYVSDTNSVDRYSTITYAKKSAERPDSVTLAGYDGRQALAVDTQNNAYVIEATAVAFKPANQVQTNDQTTYEGVDGLKASGVSSAQISSLKLALQSYAKTSGGLDKAIKVGGIAKVPHDFSTPNTNNYVTFTITIGNKVGAATMRYFNLTSIQLIVADPISKTQTFDSGAINVSGF